MKTLETIKKNQKVVKNGNVTILAENVNGKELEKIQSAEMTEEEKSEAKRIKFEAFIKKMEVEALAKLEASKAKLFANFEAIEAKETAKANESKILECKKVDLVAKIDLIQLQVNPLLNQISVLKKELSSLKGAKVSFSNGNVIKSVKETSVFGYIQKFITESGSEGIAKVDLFTEVRKVKDSVSDDSINWSISQLAKKTDYQFSVTDGIYFAK